MVSGLAGAGFTFFVWAVLATIAAAICAMVAFVQWIEARSARAYAAAQQERLEQHRADLEVQRVAQAKAADDHVKQMRAETDTELADAREAVANANREARVKAEEALRQRSRTLDERGWAVAAEERQSAERLRQVRGEVQALEDLQHAHDVGIYRPVYAFDEPTQYQLEIEAVRAKQAAMVRDGKAVQSAQGWTVNGSVAQGRQMVEREGKLVLRAFNGECDALLAKVSADNAEKLIERMTKSRTAINKLGGDRNTIADEYLLLKIAELRLVHEREQKIQLMRELDRQHRERLRDEQLAIKEIEKAQAEALKDEDRYAKALERARAEADSAGAAVKQALLDKIADLDAKLTEAQARTERAKSRAQMTRSGHVYVISNHGSFGDGVYKIGMTRRLDPLDRVRELGDASVPFLFDVHALIFTEDAPGLETALHRTFAERRVNRVNLKREFFRVSLAEIESVAQRHHPAVEFMHVAHAHEWRQSEAIRAGAPSPMITSAEDPDDPLDGLD